MYGKVTNSVVQIPSYEDNFSTSHKFPEVSRIRIFNNNNRQ